MEGQACPCPCADVSLRAGTSPAPPDITSGHIHLQAAIGALADKLIPVLDHGRGNDNGLRAGANLCCNPNTPLNAIEKVLNADGVSVHLRKVVARETRRKDVLHLLIADRSEVVRKRAQENLERVYQGEAT